jgi:DNA repair protein RadA/Sms
LILIGGEPGIGKSTLLLQVAMQMKERKVLYVSGEESARQIKLRANRLGDIPTGLFILTETSTSGIFNHAKQIEPDLLVVDSIQTLHASHIESTPGSISQIRECTGELQRFAKETHTPVFIIGHINKEGHIAGPKVLEHMVDTVLQFEGERNYSYRILRTTKNRFGSTSELGIYEMRGDGLREVSNPSEILIPQREEQLSGIAVSASVEGIRPMLIEVQALVAPAFYGTPQRTSTGFDTRRLNMLLAVLEKRGGFQIGARDVFVNIAGGLKVDDPAIDLAVVAALMSSYEDRPIAPDVAFAGEVGLSGEVRAVNRADHRIAEADKLGFKRIFLSCYNQSINTDRYQIEVSMIGKVQELYRELFG